MMYSPDLVDRPTSSAAGTWTTGSKPLRILHVFGVMNRGGAEMRTLEVMRHLPRGAVHQEFCALTGRAGSLDAEIEELGGRVHLCGLGPGFPVRFARLLRDREIDIVHSHVQLASGFILALAAAGGVRRRIAHFRSTGDGRGDSVRRRAYRRVMRQLLDRVATDLVACGETVMDHCWPGDWRGDPRCRIVYNGVNVDAFAWPDTSAEIRRELGVGLDTRLVTVVGRFDPPKNQVRAVDVFAEIAGRSAAHLLFIGRGGTEEERQTRQRSAELGLGDRVHFLGERRDILRFMSGVDAVLLTSVREGMPGVVLEALAAGTPVIASALPGVMEIARIFPEVRVHALEESNDAWASAVILQLNQPPTAATRAASRAAFRASPFSIEKATSGHLELWERART